METSVSVGDAIDALYIGFDTSNNAYIFQDMDTSYTFRIPQARLNGKCILEYNSAFSIKRNTVAEYTVMQCI